MTAAAITPLDRLALALERAAAAAARVGWALPAPDPDDLGADDDPAGDDEYPRQPQGGPQ